MTILDRRLALTGYAVRDALGRLSYLRDGVTVTRDHDGTITVRAADLPYPVLIDEAEAYRAACGLDNLIAARVAEARHAHAAELEEAAVDVELAGRRPTIATAKPDTHGWE